MKKFLTFLCAVTLVLGLVGVASATPITVDLEQNVGGYGAGSLTYSDCDTSFTGSLSVSGLISGMTYQMKLEGLNNTDLGSIGRWWVVDPSDPSGWGGRNATDATYQAEMDAGYDVLGYLLFDSFVYSDPMTINFYANSSYHTADVAQPGRPAPGDVVMPSGVYGNITFLITEDTANWATPLLKNDLSFCVSPTAPVPEPSTILLMGIGLLGLVGYSRKRAKKS